MIENVEINMDESESASTGSPPQEYFQLPEQPSCKTIIANYKANIPPVFQAKRGRGAESRLPYAGEVTRIRNLTSKPSGSLPRNALPTWKELSPQVKLPDFRDKSRGDIYYTRGRLCKTLNKTKGEFDLSDPNNQRKVLELKEYSALHDPHCKTYFNKPSVLKLLKKQKLINDRKEVLCNVHEFNHYRSYLGELFCDQVRRRIGDNQALRDLERGVNMSIHASYRQRQSRKSNNYQNKHRQLNRAYVEAIKQRGLKKVEKWKRKLNEIENQNAQMNRTRAGMYTLKHWNAFRTRQKAQEVEELKKKNTLVRIAYTESKNAYTTKYDKFVRQALFERFKADQAAIMIARDDQLDDMQELVDESLKKATSNWIQNYDKYITKCRTDPLGKFQEKQNALARKKYLMRKYFDLWIDFLIKCREFKSVDLHQSFFDVDRKLKPFVKKMKEISSSDLETDDEYTCAAGDNVCVDRKRRVREKINDLVCIHATGIDVAPTELGRGKYQSRLKPTISHEKVVKRKDSKAKKTPQVKKESIDYQERDLKEHDAFIDSIVERFKIQHDRLMDKLKPGPPPATSELRYIPTHLKSNKTFTAKQEGHKEAIRLLTDVNQILSGDKHLKKLGWRAIKK